MPKGARGQDKGWPVNITVRLRRTEPGKPTDKEAVDALTEMSRGYMPQGWKFALVDWQGFTSDQQGGYKAWTHWAGGGTHAAKREPGAGTLADVTGKLFGPLQACLAGDVNVGWERRVERVERTRTIHAVWDRPRITKGLPGGGRWAKASYARRFPGRVTWVPTKGPAETEVYYEDVEYYEAEVRAEYRG